MRAPRLEDIIADTVEARLEDLHTSEPGFVLSFDPDSLTCTAQASMAQAYVGEDGERKLATKPPCRSARVAYPGGIVFRLEPGDPVLIVYCSTGLDNWSPDKTKVVDPGDERRHTLADPFVIPLGKASETPGRNEVIVDYSTVLLGKTGLTGTRSPVMRKSDLQAISSALTTLAASLTTGGNTDGAGAITGLKTVIDTVLNAMSNNVKAT